MPWRTEDGHDGPSLVEATAKVAHAWLCRRMGEPWRMVEGWIVFGEENGNRFDLLFNEDGSANLTVRIDARSQYLTFITAVCELAAVTRCLLFSAEFWGAIDPSVRELTCAIERSRAAIFVKDPLKVLRGDSDGG